MIATSTAGETLTFDGTRHVPPCAVVEVVDFKEIRLI